MAQPESIDSEAFKPSRHALEVATVAGEPVTHEPIEPTTPGQGVAESVKDTFRTVKDALSPAERGDLETPVGTEEKGSSDVL